MPDEERIPEAWVKLPEPSMLRQVLSAAGTRHPYDFGFLPMMTRLIAAHPRIAQKFSQLFSEIMFSPQGKLSRSEREMVAAVTAAAQDCHY